MTIDSLQSSSSTEVIVTPLAGGGELLNMGLSIVVVIAAILLLGWLYSRSRLLGASGSEAIAIVAARSLGPKERLIVVEVGGQQLLLGLTPNGIENLHAFDALAIPSEAAIVHKSFAERLRSSIREIRK